MSSPLRAPIWRKRRWSSPASTLQPAAGARWTKEALTEIFKGVRKGMKEQGLWSRHHSGPQRHLRPRLRDGRRRAGRPQAQSVPPFATFDTAALSGLALGQTVLAKACQSANIPFDNKRPTRPLRHRAHHRALLPHRQSLEEPGEAGLWPTRMKRRTPKTRAEHSQPCPDRLPMAACLHEGTCLGNE